MARNLLRKQADTSRRQRLLADRVAALTTEADEIAWDAGERVVERAAALQALTSLAERDVEALTLITWHGLDVPAAAAVVGCSPHAFVVRLHRARRRLAEAVRATDQMPGLHAVPAPVGQPVSSGNPAPSTPKERA